MDEMIIESRWITRSEIELTGGISYDSAFAVANDNLSYLQVGYHQS
jgi:hypothetical protein